MLDIKRLFWVCVILVLSFSAFAAEYRVGDMIKTEGLEFCVSRVEQMRSIKGIAPQPRSTFVAIEVYIKNNQSTDLDYSDWRFILVDASSKKYYTFMTAPFNPLGSGMLRPGQDVEAWIAFEVPFDAKEFVLIYKWQIMKEPLKIKVYL